MVEQKKELTDAEKRLVIPERKDVPTDFHPCHSLLMCIPVPSITQVGTIILPDRAQIILNEGHVVEKGPHCTDQFEVGDCVTWDAQSEYRLDVDGVKFVLVKESCITMKIPKQELLDKQSASTN